MRANERTLEQSKQRFEVGLVAITDVNESQAAYDLSRANLILAQNALDNAWEALRQIVGPIKVPLSRLGDKLPLAPPEPNSIDKWAEAALAGNYGIIAATEAAEAAKKGIEIQRSGHYPTLQAQAGYDWTRSAAEFNTDIDGGLHRAPGECPDLPGRCRGFAYPPGGLYLPGGPGSPGPAAPRGRPAGQGRLPRHHLLASSDVKARQAAVVSARSNLESTQAGLEVGTRTQVDVLNAQRPCSRRSSTT